MMLSDDGVPAVPHMPIGAITGMVRYLEWLERGAKTGWQFPAEHAYQYAKEVRAWLDAREQRVRWREAYYAEYGVWPGV